jgi:SpoVK/Ycf46/Vps4 family AAA+-type ATPase
MLGGKVVIVLSRLKLIQMELKAIKIASQETNETFSKMFRVSHHEYGLGFLGFSKKLLAFVPDNRNIKNLYILYTQVLGYGCSDRGFGCDSRFDGKVYFDHWEYKRPNEIKKAFEKAAFGKVLNQGMTYTLKPKRKPKSVKEMTLPAESSTSSNQSTNISMTTRENSLPYRTEVLVRLIKNEKNKLIWSKSPIVEYVSNEVWTVLLKQPNPAVTNALVDYFKQDISFNESIISVKGAITKLKSPIQPPGLRNSHPGYNVKITNETINHNNSQVRLIRFNGKYYGIEDRFIQLVKDNTEGFTPGEFLPVYFGTDASVYILPIQKNFNDQVSKIEASVSQMADIPINEDLTLALHQLHNMIGLEKVKESIKHLIHHFEIEKERNRLGIGTGRTVKPSHAVFYGNPGTGKTTVARLMGKIYKALGVLEKGHVVELDRSQIVGQYIGHTEKIMREKIEEAMGGILFIDEAYSLTPEDDSRDFGKKALDVLITELENRRGQFICIVAGYEQEMKKFINSNPGLQSRFNSYFHFEDYTPEELMEIFKQMLVDSNLRLEQDAESFVYKHFVHLYRKRDKNFGNARAVRQYVAKLCEAQSNRIVKIPKEKWTEDMLVTITVEDVKEVSAETQNKVVHIPINEELLSEQLEKLNQLVGMSKIKEEIFNLVKMIRFQKQNGDTNSPLLGHFVLTGNPGTGKTEVARILAKIFEALGVLERGTLVEVTREKVIGQYIGHTEAIMKQYMEEAMGGVLFIDEAYSLTPEDNPRDFGKNALDVLITELENRRGQFVCILAGYREEMERFFNSNPGLRSRFNSYFHFEDYTPDEMLEIASLMLKRKDRYLSQEAEKLLYKEFVFLYRKRDRNFGNARTVRQYVDKLLNIQSLRIADENINNSEAIKVIEVQDVESMLQNSTNKMVEIPIDEELLAVQLRRLNEMIGLQKVKDEINKLVSLVRYYKEEGKDLSTLNRHMLLVGNPGTGKTEVARIIAKIYEALGILERGDCIEVDRDDLVDKYRGGTEEKTNKVIDQAMNGILFIDEAYTLTNKGPEDPGHIAVEVLLKRMEDEKGKFIVIAAGYEKEMEEFLNSNKGLRRRFDHKILFEDYNPEELLQIAQFYLQKEGYSLSSQAKDILYEHFKELYEKRDQNFGNAGLAKKIAQRAKNNLDYRMSLLSSEERRQALKTVIEVEDLDLMVKE